MQYTPSGLLHVTVCVSSDLIFISEGSTGGKCSEVMEQSLQEEELQLIVTVYYCVDSSFNLKVQRVRFRGIKYSYVSLLSASTVGQNGQISCF